MRRPPRKQRLSRAEEKMDVPPSPNCSSQPSSTTTSSLPTAATLRASQHRGQSEHHSHTAHRTQHTAHSTQHTAHSCRTGSWQHTGRASKSKGYRIDRSPYLISNLSWHVTAFVRSFVRSSVRSISFIRFRSFVTTMCYSRNLQAIV